MAAPGTMSGLELDERTLCFVCGRRRAVFLLERTPRCLWCALRYGRMLRRSVATAAVVGTIIVAINQGNVLLRGDFPAELAWKIPLTYCVPFCVATWGALINSRIRDE
jgi:hypothetical protein